MATHTISYNTNVWWRKTLKIWWNTGNSPNSILQIITMSRVINHYLKCWAWSSFNVLRSFQIIICGTLITNKSINGVHHKESKQTGIHHSWIHCSLKAPEFPIRSFHLVKAPDGKFAKVFLHQTFALATWHCFILKTPLSFSSTAVDYNCFKLLLITQSHSSSVQASSYFKFLNMHMTPTYTTPTFITEALCLITCV